MKCEYCKDPILKFQEKLKKEYHKGCGQFLNDIEREARNLFNNRLGWSDHRNPYAPREFWANLSAALYGDNDSRTKELRKK